MLLLSFLLRVWHMQTICLVLEQFLYKINVFFFLHLKDTPKQQTISNHFILLLSPAQFCTSFLQCNCFEISNMATHLLYLFFFFLFLRECRHVRLIKIEASCQCFIKISASCFGDPHMYVALGSLVRFECQKGVAT